MNWFESRAETMTAEEARSYFTESNYPKPEPGETHGEAIRRAYLADVAAAAEMIPSLSPNAMRAALTEIIEGEDPPARDLQSGTRSSVAVVVVSPWCRGSGGKVVERVWWEWA